MKNENYGIENFRKLSISKMFEIFSDVKSKCLELLTFFIEMFFFIKSLFPREEHAEHTFRVEFLRNSGGTSWNFFFPRILHIWQPDPETYPCGGAGDGCGGTCDVRCPVWRAIPSNAHPECFRIRVRCF